MSVDRTQIIGISALLAVIFSAFWPTDPAGAEPPENAAVTLLRAKALGLCAMYLPCNRGDAHFREITKDFGGSGTTCGFLIGWLLDRLGCRDNAIVNREDPDANLKYHQAQNMAAVVNGGKADGSWSLFTPGMADGPKAADIGYFGAVDGAGGISHEHVAVIVSLPPPGEAGTIVTYDLGHSVQPEGSMTSRVMHANGNIEFLGTVRRLIGFDSLALIPMTGPEDLSDHTQGGVA